MMVIQQNKNLGVIRKDAIPTNQIQTRPNPPVTRPLPERV